MFAVGNAFTEVEALLFFSVQTRKNQLETAKLIANLKDQED